MSGTVGVIFGGRGEKTFLNYNFWALSGLDVLKLTSFSLAGFIMLTFCWMFLQGKSNTISESHNQEDSINSIIPSLKIPNGTLKQFASTLTWATCVHACVHRWITIDFFNLIFLPEVTLKSHSLKIDNKWHSVLKAVKCQMTCTLLYFVHYNHLARPPYKFSKY